MVRTMGAEERDFSLEESLSLYAKRIARREIFKTARKGLKTEGDVYQSILDCENELVEMAKSCALEQVVIFDKKYTDICDFVQSKAIKQIIEYSDRKLSTEEMRECIKGIREEMSPIRTMGSTKLD